jgi:hypothetical protein
MVFPSEWFEWLDLAHVHACSWSKTNIASTIFMFMVFDILLMLVFNVNYSQSCLWPFLLAGHFSIYLLAFACTKREYCLCIQILKPKVVPDESTISTYMRYYPAVPSKFACATSEQSNKHLFYVPVPLMKRQGRSISSMLSGLFSWWVFIHLSLHKRGW